MPKNARFWTNVSLVALAHVAAIYGLIRWSNGNKESNAPSVMWMSEGAEDGIGTEKHKSSAPRRPELQKESKADSEKSRDEDENRPILTSAPSEIQLPAPTASPARTPAPASSATPKPTPKPKATLKPSPKPTQKASLKKGRLAKAKSSPKSKTKENEQRNEQSEAVAKEKEKITLARMEPTEIKSAVQKSAAPQTAGGKSAQAGTGKGRAGGSASEARFGWYGNMLHDRFYSEWVQPTSDAPSEGKNSVLVKLRIEKDGRVSSFEVVRSSGNSELDESVQALANRVTQVEPLPDGLGNGDHYDVKINFELNSE